MKLNVRGGVAVIAVAAATLTAAGCSSGGSGGGAAQDAAKSSGALDFIPKTAVGYVTFDADVNSDGWKQFDKLAKAYRSDFTSIEDELQKSGLKGDNKVDWKKDVDPWLGDSAGVAILKLDSDSSSASGDSSTSSNEGDMLGWAQLDDRAKFETFAKDQGYAKGDKVGDFTEWKKGSDNFVAVKDDMVLYSTKEDVITSSAKYSGDSISDVDGVSDAIDGASGVDNSLMTAVFTGDGIRAAAKSNPQYSTLLESGSMKDFKAAAFATGAEDKGFRMVGYGVSSGSDEVKNSSHDILDKVPADTLLAIAGDDLGGGIKKSVDEAGKENSQVQSTVGQVTGMLGVTLDDMAKSFDGQFALNVATDDATLQMLAKSRSGGASSMDPTMLIKGANFTLAMEETGDTAKTLEKLGTALGGLGGGGTPKATKLGEFDAKTMQLRGIPVTIASSKDLAALSVGKDVLTDWGSKTLKDSDAFTSTSDDAGAPSDTAGMIWIDQARLAKLMGATSASDVEPGGALGWVEGDGSNAKFTMFAQVKTN